MGHAALVISGPVAERSRDTYAGGARRSRSRLWDTRLLGQRAAAAPLNVRAERPWSAAGGRRSRLPVEPHVSHPTAREPEPVDPVLAVTREDDVAKVELPAPELIREDRGEGNVACTP